MPGGQERVRRENGTGKWCRRRETQEAKGGPAAAWRRKGGWVFGDFGKALG
jgi:hypothetical protein